MISIKVAVKRTYILTELKVTNLNYKVPMYNKYPTISFT